MGGQWEKTAGGVRMHLSQGEYHFHAGALKVAIDKADFEKDWETFKDSDYDEVTLIRSNCGKYQLELSWDADRKCAMEIDTIEDYGDTFRAVEDMLAGK